MDNSAVHNNNNNNNNEWMYIKSAMTGHVIAADVEATASPEGALRSQVYVSAPKHTDHELWRWDGQFLRNKATNLVLDIRKGKLRLMQETEICLYDAKPIEDAHNQLWGVRNEVDSFGRSLPGFVIYSKSNDDWVLDIQDQEGSRKKLILFPFKSIDNEYQLWSFIPASEKDSPAFAAAGTNNTTTSTAMLPDSPATTISSSVSLSPVVVPENSTDYFSPKGLSPAKRGSQTSTTAPSLDSR